MAEHDQTDTTTDFLAAVDVLHEDGGAVRVAAHTSSVSADAWNNDSTDTEVG